MVVLVLVALALLGCKIVRFDPGASGTRSP